MFHIKARFSASLKFTLASVAAAAMVMTAVNVDLHVDLSIKARQSTTNSTEYDVPEVPEKDVGTKSETKAPTNTHGVSQQQKKFSAKKVKAHQGNLNHTGMRCRK